MSVYRYHYFWKHPYIQFQNSNPDKSLSAKVLGIGPFFGVQVTNRQVLKVRVVYVFVFLGCSISGVKEDDPEENWRSPIFFLKKTFSGYINWLQRLDW